MKRSKIFLLPVLTAMAALTLSSCSKDGGTNNPAIPDMDKVKTAKITITVTGAEDDDYVSFVMVGGAANGNATVWKVNGDIMNNQSSVSLGEQDFTTTTTYTIELTKPVSVIDFGYQCINYNGLDSTVPLSFTYKVVVNGEVENEGTKVLGQDGAEDSNDFTYTGD